MTKKETN